MNTNKHNNVKEDFTMDTAIDWLNVFAECEKTLRAKIQHLDEKGKPQPNLGIGAGGDPIKLVDLAAENAIIEVVQRHSSSFTLISEEAGIRKFGQNPERCFITIDPIDGTTNFTHGLPFYCSSIAVSDKPVISQVFAALVVDLNNNISYTATKGKGAYKQGKQISPSPTTSLNEAVVGLDLNTFRLPQVATSLSNFIQQTKHIRHFGANALELCYVADGLTDAFVDIRGKLRTTDIAAAFLILKEAGGTITSPEGQAIEMKLDPKQKLKFIASGNKQIHKKILRFVKTGTDSC